MRQQFRAGAIACALIGSISFAAAQSSSSSPSGSSQEKLNLSPAKERIVTQGLAGQPAQSVPGFQGQMGSRAPDSAQPKPLPTDVASQVPEAKDLLFIKLPDRIVLVDPDTKMVAEIVMDSTSTTGSPPSSSPSTLPSSPSR